MKAPKNRRVFVVGYGAATPLGKTFAGTWERAVKGEAGFRKLTRCQADSRFDTVGEILHDQKIQRFLYFQMVHHNVKRSPSLILCSDLL